MTGSSGRNTTHHHTPPAGRLVASRRPRWERWTRCAASLATGGFLAALVWHFIAMHGDSFWYVATGEWMLDTGRLPERDPFAFSSIPGPWIVHMPLAQLAFGWIARHLGLLALLALCTLVQTAALLWLWFGGARSPAARLPCFPVVVLAVVVDADLLSARGQVFGDLGTAILLGLLGRLARAERVPALAPLALGALWANLHPSFLLAPALPLAVAAFLLLEPREARPALAPYLRLSALALAGACANPYHVRMVVDVVQLWTHATTAQIDLFRSPDLQDPLQLLALAAAIACGLARLRFGPACLRRADLALLLCAIGAAISARRHVGLLLGVVLVQLGRLCDAELGEHRARFLRWQARLAPLAAACAVLLLLSPKDPVASNPALAARFIEAQRLPDRVFNLYVWGGYLDYAWRGRRKVFIDGRNHLFGNGVFDDCARIEAAAPGFESLLDLYEIRTALVHRGSALDSALAQKPPWRLAYADALAAVYTR